MINIWSEEVMRRVENRCPECNDKLPMLHERLLNKITTTCPCGYNEEYILYEEYD